MEFRRAILWLRRRAGNRLLVTVGMAGFVVTVYVVVVLGGGVILGRTDAPSLPLSVVATAIVALSFAPVQSAVERVASRWGIGAPATPYEVLSRFSQTATGAAGTELPERMAMLLAQGTGAQWAQVWLNISDRLTLAATWPTDATADRSPPALQADGSEAAGEGRRAHAVRHGGQLLGVLRLRERPGLALTGVEERLFVELAVQAGLVLRLAGLRAELEERHDELMARADELKASRARLIATQDAERRRLERDLHDGAQQHLVALSVNLRLAQTIAGRSPERAARLLVHQADAAGVAIETLSSLSRGIYPRSLASEGLVPALRLAVSTSPIPVTIDSTTTERLPAALEAALYFCCMEAVQNAAKHSGARSVSVRFATDNGRWCLTIVDDGAGFDPGDVREAEAGVGLASLRDRLDAVGGRLTVESQRGVGTTITAQVR